MIKICTENRDLVLRLLYGSSIRLDKLFKELYISLLFFMCMGFTAIYAQPSGGPYGPINQTYDLPKVTGKMYYAAPDGKAENSGKTLENPTTLEAAIEKVQGGDAIILRGGIYRTGNLMLNQEITIQPYKDEQPVLRGTLIADKWTDLGNGLWTTTWTHLFPSLPADWWRRNREGKQTPLYRFNNDMVFLDGKFLQAAGWEGDVDENSYYIDYDNRLVYIGIDPVNKLIEITAHDAAIIRTTKDVNGKPSDHKGYTIKGITFTQYAYRALEIEGTEPEGISPESEHGKDVVGSTLENCTISYCSRVAGYFRGDHLTIKHCKISNTSTEGVYVIASNDVLLEGNIFTRNNIENITGYYPAAVKIFNQCHRVICNDNLVIDLPNSNGIWYDVGNVDGRFTNNWVQNVGHIDKSMPTNQVWPSDNGFFFEISKGVVCAGNVFVNCDHGIMILNSSNARIYQNTFVNSTACIGRNGRTAAGDHFGWHPSTGPDVNKREGHVFINNLLTGNENFNRPLLFVWQPANLCDSLNKPQLKQLDYNMYVSNTEKPSLPVILWSPASNNDCQLGFDSLATFRKLYPGFSENSRYYAHYKNPLFKSPELNDYHLLGIFPGADLGTKLPDEPAKLLKNYKNESHYVGAYPPVE